MLRVAKVITLPVLVDKLNATPAVEDLLMVVPANVTAAFEFAMLIPAPVGFVIVVAPVTLTVPPPTACKNPIPDPPEIESVPNVRVPLELFCRDTPSVPPDTLVFPKSIFAVEPLTRIPWLAGLVIVVPPVTVIVPATLESEMPCPPLLDVEVMTLNVAASVPVAKLNGRPVPVKPTALVVKVPKLDPVKSMPAELRRFNPRIMLFCARVTVLPALLSMSGFVEAGGNAVLPVGTEIPVTVARSTPCPINCMPFASVKLPVYGPEPEYTNIMSFGSLVGADALYAAMVLKGVLIRPSPPPAAALLMNQMVFDTVMVTVPVSVCRLGFVTV